jgi:ATP-dependent Clp protease ATP-binding subunit ClpA
MTYILSSLLAAALLSPCVFAASGGDPEPGRKVDAQKPADKPRAPLTKNALVRPHPVFWTFENGHQLLITPDSGVEFIEKNQIRAEKILSGKVLQYPRVSGDLTANANFPYALPRLKIAFIQLGREPYIVTQNGDAVKIPFDLDKMVSGKNILRFNMRPVDVTENGIDKRFYVLSLAYGPASEEAENELEARPEVIGSFNKGETFVIREDGQVQRLDYRYHGPEFDNVLKANELGFLKSTGSEFHRAFDLLAFEQEKEFVARPIHPVKSQGGGKADPAEILPGFARNLSAEISDDVLERHLSYEELDQETRDVFRRMLAKVEMNSMVVLGPAGTGKTELVKQFIAEVNAGMIADIPRSTLFIGVDASSLNAGTMWRGSEMTRIEALVAISKIVPVVLVMDEIHAIKGSGTSSKNDNDIWETLKPHLASGRLKVIGMSTESEFNRAYSNNRPLYERFFQHQLKLPTKDQAIRKAASWTRKHGLPRLSPDALEFAYDLSEEFNAVGAQPRKMILLLIDAYADMKISGRKNKAPSIEDLKVSARRVYNLDPNHFNRDAAKARAESLKLKLDATVIGQEDAKASLVRQATISLAGAHDPGRPRLTAVFAGPKGAGKTELALAYGDAMGVPNKRLLLGSYDEYDGVLALLRDIKSAVQANAFTNFVLDEADKARPKVLEALLPLLDKGRFTLPSHQVRGEWIDSADVSVQNASFIFAGNFGRGFAVEKPSFGFMKQGIDAGPTEQQLREAVVADGFNEFLLDRVDSVSYMNYLEKHEFREVLALNVEKILAEQSKRQSMQIDADDKSTLIDALNEQLWQPQLSSREALRLLNKELRFKIAEAVLKSAAKPKGLNLRYNADSKSVEACEDLVSTQKGA